MAWSYCIHGMVLCYPWHGLIVSMAWSYFIHGMVLLYPWPGLIFEMSEAKLAP